MKGKAPQAAKNLRELSLGFAARQADRQPRIFWKIAAAYFEAVAHDLLGSDIYVRRAASRILMQYALLAKGDPAVSERLAQDLLFFCAQAVSARASDTPVLSAVRSTYGLNRFKPVDYELVQFGRFDPALLAQARKRITSAKETWSSLSAGDANKFKTVSDQFSLVTDSLLKLHPPSEPLAQALSHAVETTVRSGQAPGIELAMEVATSVLYLEAAFDDLDPNDPQLAVRTANLASRLEGVRAGGQPQPLEGWMEELYRRVSDKQTMGSVVGELRISLGELEKSLDVFFRNPQDKVALQSVPGQLSQMRGVLSVLGLDQASHAVLRMRDSVEQMLVTEIDEQMARAAGTFEHLGNNLGALSFLIDMLNYQPALAKKLFVYDEEKGELKPLMGRAQNASTAASSVTVSSDMLSQEVISVVQDAGLGEKSENLTIKLDALATHAALAEQPGLAQTARDASAAVSGSNADAAATAMTTLAFSVTPASVAAESQDNAADFGEDDLRDIFLEEAREVVGNGLEALAALASDPTDVSQLTVLRRAFHTLKGSSRMVGLNEFGEAAWSLEQMLNSWLADQKGATDEFRALASEAMNGFANWIADIASNQDGAWSASVFRTSADAMRTEARYVALNLSKSAAAQPAAPAVEAAAAEVFSLPDLQLDAGTYPPQPAQTRPRPHRQMIWTLTSSLKMQATPAAVTAQSAASVSEPAAEIEGIDFDSLSAISGGADISPVAVESAAVEQPAPSTPDEAQAIELSDADFEKHFHAEPAKPDETTVVFDFAPHRLQPVAASSLPEPFEFAEPVQLAGSAGC
jgi:chemosensory pili system protein ChpA (sensor histidine kinase/response regulator)